MDPWLQHLFGRINPGSTGAPAGAAVNPQQGANPWSVPFGGSYSDFANYPQSSGDYTAGLPQARPPASAAPSPPLPGGPGPAYVPFGRSYTDFANYPDSSSYGVGPSQAAGVTLNSVPQGFESESGAMGQGPPPIMPDAGARTFTSPGAAPGIYSSPAGPAQPARARQAPAPTRAQPVPRQQAQPMPQRRIVTALAPQPPQRYTTISQGGRPVTALNLASLFGGR